MSYAVEVTFEHDRYGHRSRCIPAFGAPPIEEPEQAAQIFESEAEPPRPELALRIEELVTEGKLEDFNEDTGKRVVAYELVEALV